MIRDATAADAEALTQIDVLLMRDGRGMVMTEDEVMPTEERRLRMEGRHTFVAEDGELLGYAELWRVPPSFCRHVGELAIGVRPDAQGRGLGRRLMESVLERAEAIGIERLQLFMRSDNPRAYALYESLGFQTESVKRRFVKLPDGTYVDDLTMVRFLNER